MTTVMVSSGGCTTLSYLTIADGPVVSIDRNPTQHHIVELKVAAADLPPEEARPFLGAHQASGEERSKRYRSLRRQLTSEARAYWDGHERAIRAGALGAGVTERVIASIMRGVKLLIHSPRRVQEMLSQPSLEAQRAYYAEHWNNRRWRAMFKLLLNRGMFPAFRRTYDPSFFEHAGSYSFADHLHKKLEHVLTALPVAGNYLLHFAFTGLYPQNAGPDSLPKYLTDEGLAELRERRDHLTLVDGGVTEYLASRPAQSVDRFALSNVAEWMTDEQVLALFEQIRRTATPGALVCFRNLVGWTEIPASLRSVFVEDVSARSLMARERSIMQRRFVLCRVEPVDE